MSNNLDLEWYPRQKMYGLVIYQLTGIQKGIQFSHAMMELARKKFADDDFLRWIRYDKTVVLLNGGTTNNTGVDHWSKEEYIGSINEHLYTLTDLGVVAEPFYEPDLNNAMTAIAFLVDEKVWNEKSYPAPSNFAYSSWGNGFTSGNDYEERLEQAYVKSYGEDGKRIMKMREFLSQFKLATN